MKRKVLFVKKFICIFFVVLVSVDAYAAVTIPANDPNILYTGRIDFTNPLAPVLSWSGTSVIANFQGTSIQATLNDMGTNYFYAIIDNGTPILITCTAGQHTYSIASGLSDTTHKIELYKRTATNSGVAAFVNFIIDNGKTLTSPPARPIRKIEYYGDSITCGIALDAPDDNQAAVNTNAYLTYSSITARNLNAEHHTIAVSGIGLVKSWWDANMPKDYYYRQNASSGSIYWDFNQWTPDCIVINLGQNDKWQGTTQSQAVTGYVDFVNLLRTRYGDMAAKKIPIILTLGSMDATRFDSPWPGYIQQAITALQNTYSDNNVYTTIFPFDELWTHPHAPQHAAMAQQLTDFIKLNIPGFNGDINGDGLVNFLDFSLLGQQWQQTGCGLCNGADLSGDNNVTLADVSIFAKNWLSDY
jgi:hypothetical protein